MTATSVGLLILRVGVGGFLATHGWGKLQMLLSGGAAQFGDPIGLGPALSLALVTLSEFFCALLIVAGLATRFAAIPPVISMSVAAFVVHAANPWTMEAAGRAFFAGVSKNWFSKEPALLYLIPALSLVFTGGGTLSLDALIAARWNRRRSAGGAPSTGPRDAPWPDRRAAADRGLLPGVKHRRRAIRPGARRDDDQGTFRRGDGM